MDSQRFDAVTRMLAGGLDRRAAVRVVMGATLAAVMQPHGTLAKKDPHHGDGSGGKDHGHGGGRGDKDKIDKKRCKQEYDDARRYWTAFCFRNFDANGDGIEQPTESVLSNCLADFIDGCTALLKTCTKQAQHDHIACVDTLASHWGY